MFDNDILALISSKIKVKLIFYFTIHKITSYFQGHYIET